MTRLILARPPLAAEPRRQAIAGWLVTVGLVGLAVVLSAGAVALIIAGYVAASRHDVDGTNALKLAHALAFGTSAYRRVSSLALAAMALTTAVALVAFP